MRRQPTEAEITQYIKRITNLEKHAVLPARIAIIVSCVAFLWPIIVANVGAKEFAQLALFKWAILTYALLSVLYWLYVFRFAQRLHSMALTKRIVFASSITDNLFLGLLLYGVLMDPLGEAWLGAAAEASLFWVYCALVIRNTFLFPGPVVQILLNALCILGYASAILFNVWGLHREELSDPAQREMLSRVTILFLVSLCSSAIYALRQRRLRELDDARERTVRSLRLDIAGVLAAQVAHELKNPLSIMTNATFLLRRSKPNLGGKLREQVDIIDDEIRRADQIITELLDYGRLAEGRIEAVVVNESLDESLAALKNELDSRGIQVEKNYYLDLPFLLIDPGQLRQIFTNILLNACEASENGGTITIATSYSRQGFIEVSISDTGKGMPPDVLSNIFKPFFTTKEKGTGMGLSIVQNMVRAYRGEITAKSRVGEGTTFHLRLPTRMAILTEEQGPRSQTSDHTPQSIVASQKR